MGSNCFCFWKYFSCFRWSGPHVNGKNKSHNKIDVLQDIDSDPSNVQSASQEALLFAFEDNEAVIKMIMKGRSLAMRHVSRTHRVALDWLFDRLIWKLADILTKGNFTRDEWNHVLTLFNISHYSSTSCIAAMAKPVQQESGEGRVTAKSRPMMNLTARTPSFVSSSGSANLGRSSYGYQDPEQPVLDDRTGRPDSENVQGKANLKSSSWEVTQQNLSIKSGTKCVFRQKRMSSDVAEDCTEHSIVWGNF